MFNQFFPQGSILGTLFLVIFINDLPDVVCSDNTIALYVDDSKMFRVIDCDEDLIYFQEDLEKLHHWSERNQMDFNTKECKIMRITRKRLQVPFTNSVHMNDTVLEEVKEFKDLGILTDCSLSWNSHTDMIAAKAKRMLSLINRTCKDLKDTAKLKTLYCSLIRSYLEYWSVVWSSFIKRNNIDKLEIIQRRATKFILKSNEQYDIRLSKFKLLTLEQRGFLFDVAFCLRSSMTIRIFWTFVNFWIFIVKSTATRFDTLIIDHYLKKRFFRTNVLKNSFFHRTVDRWNILTFEIHSGSNVCNFKFFYLKL